MKTETHIKRVAIVHYWLVGMRGGESVLESLCDIFPHAVIYTHVINHKKISKKLLSHEIRTTFISKLPYARQNYSTYLPLMPIALECLDLSEFDLVISCESGPTKGVVVRPDATHICYSHSPMRYIWDQYHVYRSGARFLTKLMMPLIAHYLRVWDVSSSSRVDHFIANSTFVKGRIKKYYRRESRVIFPPVNIKKLVQHEPTELGDYYLWVGELVSYKRPDVLFEAFSKLDKKLIVVGAGNVKSVYSGKLGDNVEVLGRVSDQTISNLMSGCLALIFPGVEDFGIVPLEVMACGRPIIAYSAGGALDTVIDGKCGCLYNDPSSSGLIKAIERFEYSICKTIDSKFLVDHASKFSQSRFEREFKEYLLEMLN